MKEELNREGILINEARRLASPEARADFLARACGEDSALRKRIEARLEAAEQSEDSDAHPPVSAGASSGEQLGGRIGRYKILEKIAEGGFGVVYVAEQREPVKRRVALKVIKLGMDTKQVVARFEAERQALALMDHPNIAKVLDAGATETGRPFFVMELVKGIPITEYCDQEKLATRNRLDLFIQVCHATQHAHQKGIIHRDIKPSNILVTLHDGVPVPKVIDFGIAKATQQELTDKTVYTQFQQFIGTPAYMSPEQAEMSGLDIDTRSDIYSLGVLLYELLTGSTPFDTKELLQSGLDEMRKIIRERQPVRPSTRLSQTWAAQHPSSGEFALRTPHSAIDNDLDWIVMKCLEKDRTRRYDTANGLAMDIERHLKHEPVVARPPTTSYRLQKAWRRNKLAFIAAAAVVAALVFGVGISTWQAIVASRARDAEKEQRLAARAAQKEAERAQQAEKRERLRAERREAEAGHLLYVADMNLASQAWGESDIGRVRDLLDRHRPQAGQKDLRAWEWRYLWRLSRNDELFTLTGHTRRTRCVAFSPDGSKLAAGGEDGLVTLWDMAARRRMASFQHPDCVNGVTFSPDGKQVVSCCSDRAARFWDVQTLTETGKIEVGAWLKSAVFSPDGSTLALLSGDGQLALYDARTHEQIQSRQLGSTLSAYLTGALTYSPNSKMIAVGMQNGDIHLLSPTQLQRLKLLRNGGPVSGLGFSPDSQTLAAGGWNNLVRIWDVANSAPKQVLTNHQGWIAASLFSPDGTLLATASADQTIRLWDATTWQSLQVLRGHSDELAGLAFAPDGLTLASVSKDETIKVWSAIPHAAERDRLEMPAGLPGAMISSDLRTLVSWSPGGRVLLTDLSSSRRLGDYTLGFTNLTGVDITHDHRLLALTKTDGPIVLYDLKAGVEVGRLGSTNAVGLKFPSFSPDGRVLAVSASDQNSSLWDVPARKLLGFFSWRDVKEPPVFAPNSTLLAAPGLDGSAHLWDARSAARLKDLGKHKGGMCDLAFSSDGRLLASAGEDGLAKVFEISTGRELASFRAHRFALNLLSFSHDGQRLITGSNDGFMKFWDLTTQQEVLTCRQSPGLFGVFFCDDDTVITQEPGFFSRLRAPPLSEIDSLPATARFFDTNTVAAVVVEPEVLAASLLEKGRNLAQHGHQDAAAACLAKAIQLQPEDHWNWYLLAPLLAGRGDSLNYRTHCHAMLARFGGTTDPRIAERTAKSCLLLPVERADLAVANQFADRAVSVGANDASLVYYQFVKCLAEYRLGQFTNSVEWARKTLTQAGGISELYVQASSVLAMALHQLKQFDEARATMSKGVEFAKTELPSLDGPDLGDRWHDILIAHILLGEAQTLIEDGQVRGKEIK